MNMNNNNIRKCSRYNQKRNQETEKTKITNNAIEKI